MEREKIMFIIRATATWRARPDYFAITSVRQLREMCSFLRDDWVRVEYREIKRRDSMLEGIISRCSLGSERLNANLQAYYNIQEAA